MDSDAYRQGYAHGCTPGHPFTPPHPEQASETERAAYVRGFDDGLDNLINKRERAKIA